MPEADAVLMESWAERPKPAIPPPAEVPPSPLDDLREAHLRGWRRAVHRGWLDRPFRFRPSEVAGVERHLVAWEPALSARAGHWTPEEIELATRWRAKEDPGERAAEDWAVGSIVQHRGEPHRLVHGHGEHVLLQAASGRVSRVRAGRSLRGVAVADGGRAQRLTELLLADSLARGSNLRACRATERLADLDASALGRADHVRRAACRERLGDRAGAWRSLEAAAAFPAGAVATEHTARSVRAALLAAEAEAQPERRADAVAAHEELAAFVRERVQRPAALAAVHPGLFRLRSLQRAEAQDRTVALALQLAGGLLLLLPLAWLVDDWRTRRGRPDLELPEELLPGPRVALAWADGRVAVPPDAWVRLQGPGEVRRDELRSRLQGPPEWPTLTLEPGERLLLGLGERLLCVRRVPRAAPIRGRWGKPDLAWWGTFLGLLVLASAGAVVASHLPSSVDRTELSDLAPQPRIARVLQPPPLSPVGGSAPAAAGSSGPSGPRRPTLVKTASGERTRKRAEVQRMLDSLLAPMGAEFAAGALGRAVDEAAQSLVAGEPDGAGGPGLGSRTGDGSGGGGESLHGVGTRPGGQGGDGGGRWGPGTGERPRRAPPASDRPIVLRDGIDKSAIERVVRQRLPLIRHCYDRGLAANPALQGKVVVKFVIDDAGGVSVASVKHSTLDDATVESCVAQRFLTMRFPEPKGGGTVAVAYPFVFSAKGGGSP